MVALDSDAREPARSHFDIAIAVAIAVALVVGVYALGRTIDNDDATPGVAATQPSDGDQAAAPAADGAHAHGEADAATATPVDDRGFAALENGEEHGHTFTQAVSPEDRIELGRQLALTREVALRYPTVKDAEAAGLHRAGPFSPGLGAHYISYGNALSNSDGVMSDEDINKPLAWIYDGTKPDSRVAGLFYMTTVADAAGFAGPNDIWHVHHDVCIKAGANGVIDAPLGADNDATKEQCDAVGGDLLEQTQYLLHVWTVPGYESSEGVFSHLSSAITCDDGTYNTIPDVTKVGSATTICLDGTE